jgi:hypothetical protein
MPLALALRAGGGLRSAERHGYGDVFIVELMVIALLLTHPVEANAV